MNLPFRLRYSRKNVFSFVDWKENDISDENELTEYHMTYVHFRSDFRFTFSHSESALMSEKNFFQFMSSRAGVINKESFHDVSRMLLC